MFYPLRFTIIMGRHRIGKTGYTRLGYWHDRKGENEIDITTENEVDNKIEFIEVKRQTKNFDENVLKAKSELFLKVVGSFKGYEIIYRGLSTEACNSARRVRPLFIFHLIF